jgi:hypothetical protein
MNSKKLITKRRVRRQINRGGKMIMKEGSGTLLEDSSQYFKIAPSSLSPNLWVEQLQAHDIDNSGTFNIAAHFFITNVVSHC